MARRNASGATQTAAGNLVKDDLLADEKLQSVLDRQAREHDAAAENARRERRAVWLRLHEHGYTYAHLGQISGCGSTTLWKELARARRERDLPENA